MDPYYEKRPPSKLWVPKHSKVSVSDVKKYLSIESISQKYRNSYNSANEIRRLHDHQHYLPLY